MTSCLLSADWAALLVLSLALLCVQAGDYVEAAKTALQAYERNPTPQHSPGTSSLSDKDGVDTSARRALDYNYNRLYASGLGNGRGVGRFMLAGDDYSDHYS